jgi:phosphotransferase system enzyme I (PtsI)
VPFGQDVQTGIMIEVPSAVEVADVLAREVDFFSIGTNDLIQYAMAIDRVNENVAHMYEPLHPAILRMISRVVKCGHDNGIEVGLCGEMAGDITFLPLLLGLGIDEFSTHPPVIPHIKRMIRNSTAARVAELTEKIFTLNSANEIRNYLCGYLPRNYPDEFGAKKYNFSK